MFSGSKRYVYVLTAITIAGLALRINGLWHSFTADEISALLRLHYGSFSEMIDKGVRPDGHPALTQVWLWCWTKMFGWSEFSVRLPFALAGAASILYAAGIAKRWFGETCALATAAAIAFLEFPLLYSQLARPYAPGLLFSLMTVYYWSGWFFPEKKRTRSSLILFVISAALALYTHYFSFLFVGIVGLTGLIFTRREMLTSYLIAGAAIVALYLPHFGIFLTQLKTGGIGQAGGGWLSVPRPEFLWNHLRFCFNESTVVLVAMLVSAGIAVFVIVRDKSLSKFHILALSWWVLPLLTGYFYSVYRNPVLQHSVLLFSFPFFVMFCFSWLQDFFLELRVSFALLIAGCLGIFAHTVIRHKYDLLDHFGRLRELVEFDQTYSKRYGEKNITRFYNVDAPYFVSYYWDKLNFHPEVSGTINDGHEELKKFREVLDRSNGDYFYYCWSTKYSPYEILDMIRERYPYLVQRQYFYNSEVYLFSKKELPETIREKPTSSWGLLADAADTSATTAPAHWQALTDPPKLIPFAAMKLDGTNQFSPPLEKKIVEIAKSPNAVVDIRCWIKPSAPDAEVVLVADFGRGNEKKSFHWTGESSQTQLNDTTYQQVYYSFLLPDDVGPDDVIKIYAYNPGKKPVLVSFLEAKVWPGNPIIYGKRGDYY